MTHGLPVLVLAQLLELKWLWVNLSRFKSAIHYNSEILDINRPHCGLTLTWVVLSQRGIDARSDGLTSQQLTADIGFLARCDHHF
jgi:hypothetical protein